MRSESGQKETPVPVSRKRSRKGIRGQQGKLAATVAARQTNILGAEERRLSR